MITGNERGVLAGRGRDTIRASGPGARLRGVLMSTHTDDPEKMAQMRAWLTTVEKELDLDASALDTAEGPLLGVATGHGGGAAALGQRIDRLAAPSGD